MFMKATHSADIHNVTVYLLALPNCLVHSESVAAVTARSLARAEICVGVLALSSSHRASDQRHERALLQAVK